MKNNAMRFPPVSARIPVVYIPLRSSEGTDVSNASRSSFSWPSDVEDSASDFALASAAANAATVRARRFPIQARIFAFVSSFMNNSP